MNRRTVLLAAGGAGLALTSVGAFGAWRVTRVPRTAQLPWNAVATPSADPRLDALRHAILAPNPHNRQPWLMRLDGDDGVTVTCDLNRRLPETDPFDRQLTVGFGCFLELARISAAERGQRVELTPFPEGEPAPRLDGRPIAHLRFVADPTVTKDPLFAAILQRRSTKEPYDLTRPVAAASLGQVMAEGGPHVIARGTAEPERVATIRAITLDAGTIEVGLPRTHKESVDLIRIGHDEVDANPDGIDLAGPFIEGLKLAGQLDREQLADPQSRAFAIGRDMQREIYGSAPAYVWLTTGRNGRVDQLAAGAAYVRVNLAATLAGLAMHPASQSLQEFPEMAEPYRRVHEALGAVGDERVQILARIGYGPAVPPSPRWPLESRVLTT